MLFSLITCFASALGVFEKALTYFRSSAPELKEERAMLLESWLNMEVSFGELGDVSLVQSKLPKKLKKRRPIMTEDGPAGYVLIHYIFTECTVVVWACIYQTETRCLPCY